MDEKSLATLSNSEPFNPGELTLKEMSFVANEMAQAKMFTDIDSAHKAFVKIMAGSSMGVGPFEAVSGIHIIQGKAVMGAGLMAGRVKGSGKYDYRVTEQTDKKCSINFLQRYGDKWELIGTSEFTIEDAKAAGTKNLEKFPKNMLFARAMSNGVKWFCPDVFGSTPVYTEGEIIEADGHEVAPTPPPAPKPAKAAKADEPAPEPEIEMVTPPEEPAERPYDTKQMRRIMAMLDEMGFKTDPEKKAVFTGMTKLESRKDLTYDGAEKLIAELTESDPEGLRLAFISNGEPF